MPTRPPMFARKPADGGEATTVEHRCAASIGIELFNGLAVSEEDLLKAADLAMYQAKEAGEQPVLLLSAEGGA